MCTPSNNPLTADLSLPHGRIKVCIDIGTTIVVFVATDLIALVHAVRCCLLNDGMPRER